MNETLKVIIEGDAKDLNAELNQAGQRVDNFTSKTQKAGNAASKSFGTVKKTSGNATNSVLEFNRVIQDAPFGIQGVANNLTQLTQSFGQLRAETGSTRGALKAFLAGFAGPAGILFAVSAVTSALVAYSSSQSSAKSETESAADAINKQKEALNNFISTISDVNKARIQANASAFEELTILNLLRQRAEDVTASQESRNKSVNELQRLYPTYFANASKEDILNGNLKTSYDSLTLSIQNRAKATAALNLLTKNEEESLKLELQRDKILADIAQKEADINILLEKGQSIQSQTANTFILAAEKEEKQVAELNKELATVTTRIQEIGDESTKLSNLIDIDDIIEPPEVKEPETLSPTFDLSKATEISREFAKGLNFAKTGTVAFNSALNSLDDTAATTTAGLNQVSVDGLSTYNTALTQALAKTQIFTEAASAGFSALASQIANSLSTGNAFVDAFVSSILQSLAQLAAQFIATQLVEAAISQAGIAVKKEVANANAAVAATSAAAALGPFGLAALPGLLAGARGIVEASFASAKFATGGIVPGGSFVGDRTPILANGGEMIFNSRQQRNLFDMVDRNLQGGVSDFGGTVVFEVEGTRLVGVLNNASRQSRRNGGALRLT